MKIVISYNYNWTNQVYNSESAIGKAVKYSLIGISLVGIAETIANIVLTPFKIFSAFYYSIKEDNETKDKKVEPQKVEPQSIKKVVISDVKKESSKTSYWKTIIVGATTIVAGLIGYKSYKSSLWKKSKIDEYLSTAKAAKDYEKYAFAGAHYDELTGKPNWFDKWQKNRKKMGIENTCKPTGMFRGTNEENKRAHLVFWAEDNPKYPIDCYIEY